MLKKLFLKRYKIVLVNKVSGCQYPQYSKVNVYAYGKKDLKETIAKIKNDWDDRINVDTLYEQMLNIPKGCDGVELLNWEVTIYDRCYRKQ